MNNGTFSSGGIAVYRMKKYANAIIIGENSGGKICSYGQTMYLNVENKRFSCSTKLFDFSDFFGYNGSIRPDVYVAYTIDDLFTGRDSQFEKAVELLVN
jgi:C-terminal processing protease CtpA/Prc